jgi:hypothetical protein
MDSVRFWGFALIHFGLIRRCAAGAVFASLGAILAGCTANQGTGPQATAIPSGVQPIAIQQYNPPRQGAANGSSPAKSAAHGSEVNGSTVVAASMTGPQSMPVPAARPDLGDRVLVADKAGSATPPADGKPAVPTAATLAAVEAGMRSASSPAPVKVARAAVPPGPQDGARPPHDEDDPEPSLSATDERIERSITNDQNRENLQASLAVQPEAVAAPVPPSRPAAQAVLAKAVPAKAGPAIVTTAAYAPAVMEVDGVSKSVAGTAAHRVIKASLATGVQHNVAATSGRFWRAAYPHVVTGCFDTTLRNALNTIGRHYGTVVEVTSGHRTRGRRRSMHRFCRAADIRVPGVRPSALARFARSIPGINGVGTYRRKSIVHIDTRLQTMVWRY